MERGRHRVDERRQREAVEAPGGVALRRAVAEPARVAGGAGVERVGPEARPVGDAAVELRVEAKPRVRVLRSGVERVGRVGERAHGRRQRRADVGAVAIAHPRADELHAGGVLADIIAQRDADLRRALAAPDDVDVGGRGAGIERRREHGGRRREAQVRVADRGLGGAQRGGHHVAARREEVIPVIAQRDAIAPGHGRVGADGAICGEVGGRHRARHVTIGGMVEAADGETLAAALARAGAGGGGARLELVAVVEAAVEAVAAAHTRRVVHGAIAPERVRVGARGDAVVDGWPHGDGDGDGDGDRDGDGDARPDDVATVAGGGPLKTAAPSTVAEASAAPVGAYVAPERVAGADADARGDVYALGAILYHVLAGRAPYAAARDELALAVLRGPPPALAAVAPAAPRALVAIAEVAMARDARDRYANAGALAAALRAFRAELVAGAPAASRRVRARRWLRRRRVPVALAGVAVAAAVTAGALGASDLARTRDDARADAARLARASAASLVDRGRAELLAGRADRAGALLAAAYAADPASASPELRFLLRSATRVLDTAGVAVPAGAPVHELAFDHGERKLLVVRDGAIQQWGIDGEQLATLAAGPALATAQYSTDDGAVIGVGGDEVRVWDAHAGDLVFDKAIPDLRIAMISYDGRTLLTLDGHGSARQWIVATGEQRRVDELGGDPVRQDATMTGSRLVTLRADGTLAMWEWEHDPPPLVDQPAWRRTDPQSSDIHDAFAVGCRGREVDGIDRLAHVHFILHTPAEVASCSIDVSGLRTVASDRDGIATAWRTSSGERMSSLRVGRGVTTVRLAASDTVVATAPFDDTASGFALETGTLLWRHASPSGSVPAVAPDTGRVAIAREDGSVDVFRSDRGRLIGHVALDDDKPVYDVRGELAVVAMHGAAVLWDARAGRPRLSLAAPARLDASGRHVAGVRDGAVVVLDAGSARELARIAAGSGAVRDVDVDLDGGRVAIARDDGVTVWDAATGARLVALPPVASGGAVRLAGDGAHLAVIAPDGHVAIHAVDTAAAIATLDLGAAPLAIATTGDGARLAIAAADAHVAVVDFATGARVLDAPVPARALAFDRGGDLLAMHDGERIRVWRVPRGPSPGAEVARIATGYTPGGAAVALSPDGRLVATAAGVWSVADGSQLAAWLISGHHTLDPPVADATGAPVAPGVASWSDGGVFVTATPSVGLTTLDVSVETRPAAVVSSAVAQTARWRVVDGALVR